MRLPRLPVVHRAQLHAAEERAGFYRMVAEEYRARCEKLEARLDALTDALLQPKAPEATRAAPTGPLFGAKTVAALREWEHDRVIYEHNLMLATAAVADGTDDDAIASMIRDGEVVP